MKAAHALTKGSFEFSGRTKQDHLFFFLGRLGTVKSAKVTFAVLALAMQWQISVMAQNAAQPHPATNSGQEQESTVTRQTPATSSNALAESQPPGKQPADEVPRRFVEMWNTGDFHPIGSMFTQPVFITVQGQRRLLVARAL